ncbi:hypothetical protein M135_2088 [Bacteroides fragilis str. S36L5]|uniref:Uncharacterized protein n=2 Tax=Bacteroides fragilis TaxID=817 RepID=A0A015XB83_BACFG|nr:hypothetical protein M136_1785 [Bacteroides fragilis str. S36L11]EYA85015.1 hypothetical protein M137_3066 [Bacteroides fragilis str. S36L12]EYA91272.1 hypothetical protein M135_2088 [Bacteroides fragilis str. S36L5]
MACSCSLFLILLTVTGCDREEDERFPSGHHDPIEGDVWGIERSGFFNGREKWAKGFENQRV